MTRTFVPSYYSSELAGPEGYIRTIPYRQRFYRQSVGSGRHRATWTGRAS